MPLPITASALRFDKLKTKKASWGDKVLSVISDRLREELPGLRGFSVLNLKKMRLFYEVYPINVSNVLNDNDLSIGSTLPIQFPEGFWSVNFTSHMLIINKAEIAEERHFYIQRCVQEGWSSRTLLHHLKNELYHREGRMPSNFESTIPEVAALTMAQFRNECSINAHILPTLAADDYFRDNGLLGPSAS